MTSRELYESALIELNKHEAPSLLLEDYNYFINKAVQQYANLMYAKFEMDQQSTDDIRVLKASTILKPTRLEIDETLPTIYESSLHKATYFVDLPRDYTHLLNCIVEYKVNRSNYKCYNVGDKVLFPAKRLTSEMFQQIINNAYLKPTYKRPYYFITNLNNTAGTYTAEEGMVATNKVIDERIMKYNSGPDSLGKPTGENWNGESYAISNLLLKEDSAGDRMANASRIRMELRFGNDDSIFVPNNVYVDYLKAPMYIRLTQEQIDSTLDYSQLLEFPDYVCYEIINIFVRLLMENAGDPRLQTNVPINNTIANPAQQTENKK